MVSSSLPALFDGPSYTDRSFEGLHGSCLALHPVRFTRPSRSPGMPVGSYPTISPITCAPKGTPAGILSVALAVTTPVTGSSAFLLGSTAPCGVRTFLTVRKSNSAVTRPAQFALIKRRECGIDSISRQILRPYRNTAHYPQ